MEGEVIDQDDEEEGIEDSFEEEEEEEEEDAFEEEEEAPVKKRRRKVVETKPSVGDILNYTKASDVDTYVIDEAGNRVLCESLIEAKVLSLLLEQRNLLLKISKVLSKRFGKKNG